jgi:hypothetical protein
MGNHIVHYQAPSVIPPWNGPYPHTPIVFPTQDCKPKIKQNALGIYIYMYVVVEERGPRKFSQGKQGPFSLTKRAWNQ